MNLARTDPYYIVKTALLPVVGGTVGRLYDLNIRTPTQAGNLELVLQAIRETEEAMKQSNIDLENYTCAMTNDLRTRLRTIITSSNHLLDHNDKMDRDK